MKWWVKLVQWYIWRQIWSFLAENCPKPSEILRIAKTWCFHRIPRPKNVLCTNFQPKMMILIFWPVFGVLLTPRTSWLRINCIKLHQSKISKHLRVFVAGHLTRILRLTVFCPLFLLSPSPMPRDLHQKNYMQIFNKIFFFLI